MTLTTYSFLNVHWPERKERNANLKEKVPSAVANIYFIADEKLAGQIFPQMCFIGV